MRRIRRKISNYEYRRENQKGGHAMTGDDLLTRMVRDVKAGKDIEKVVDRYCICRTPRLRQQLIDGIRQIVGNDMIEKAMRI